LKKKILYGIILIVLVVGLSFILKYKFGIFSPYNTWTAQQDIKKGKIQYLEFSQEPLNSKTKQELAKSYGFNLIYFDCCETTVGVLNGSDFYNRKMIEYLENKYNKGWWTHFQAQLDSIDKIKPVDSDILVSDLVGSIPLVEGLNKNHSDIRLYPILYDKLKNIYLVKVIDKKGITYYNFLVDANKMKIINPDGKLDK
jgi:hypothetical protein